MNKKFIQDVNPKGQTVLVRVDYNVPMQDGKIIDDLRIRASLPTINYLREHGAKKIILMSHLGRPEGTKVSELSLKPIAQRLKKLLKDTTVDFIEDVSGPEVEEIVDKLPKGGVLLLENLRFHSGEEANSNDFMREIVDSTHAELFIQDGFAVAHRAHASTSAIAEILPAVGGLLVERELTALTKVIENPEHPLAVIIGGAKVKDKQPLIDKFNNIADQILVGGKIAADGYQSDNPKVYVAEDFDEDAAGAKLDIGPIATAKMIELLEPAKTVIWNGDLGKVEDPAYATSSTVIAKYLGEKEGITAVICGGDTTAFVEHLQKESKNLRYFLVSTGGGAALEFLSGLSLPGVDALEDR